MAGEESAIPSHQNQSREPQQNSIQPDNEIHEKEQNRSTNQDSAPQRITTSNDNETDNNPNNRLPLSKIPSTKSIADTLPLGQEILFVGLICCAQLTTQAGLGSCLTILHVIGAHYHLGNPGELSWLIAAYSLTVGTFILLAGRLGDVYGYKPMLIIGFGWFALWSLVAGLAAYSNHVLFDMARALQGVGPAMCLPNGLAILGASYAPGPRKAMVFAVFGATAPGGAIVGGVFAGLFKLAWWPWTFWSFGMALACIAILGVYIIPSPPPQRAKPSTLREKISELDLPGGLTGITALILVNFAWNQSGVATWTQPYVYTSLILGLLFFLIFLLIETRLSRSPLIPIAALTPDVAFVLASVASGWSSFGIWVYYIWQFYETLRGASPLQAALWALPVAISGALASVTTGFLLGRLRPAWVMTIALTAFTVGTILIATAPVGQSYWAQSFVCTIIIPWGMDMSFPAATLILSDGVAKEHQGMAASLVNTVVNYSISLALGFAGTIESHVSDGDSTPEDVLMGYRGAWYFAIGTSGFGLFLSLVFLSKGYWKDRRRRKDGGNEPEGLEG